MYCQVNFLQGNVFGALPESPEPAELPRPQLPEIAELPPPPEGPELPDNKAELPI